MIRRPRWFPLFIAFALVGCLPNETPGEAATEFFLLAAEGAVDAAATHVSGDLEVGGGDAEEFAKRWHASLENTPVVRRAENPRQALAAEIEIVEEVIEEDEARVTLEDNGNRPIHIWMVREDGRWKIRDLEVE